MLSAEEIKKIAGIYAADFVKHEMTIGLGTGTTVYSLIQELGKRIEQGFSVTAVPTSERTAQLAKKAGIVPGDLNAISRLALTIDGADEIDPQGQLIKGGGGALLREKIVAAASDELVIIADSSKLVHQLGRFPLPVEVVPFGYKQVMQRIIQTGLCKGITLRKKNEEIFITDHNHYILDCEFEKIDNASSLNNVLHNIPGVVETGLFINMATKAVVGFEDGRIEVISYK
ncbi:MAG: ribose-5-phosphate isomerase RpiA [Ginsengibacter sp.]